jgi:hypothetical protein
MHSLKVRSPVSKSMHDNVVKRLASNSVKTEIYMNGESSPSKVYYVGGANADHSGTFMLLEGSSVPFIMHLEGLYGFLNTRYTVHEMVWRDNYIWQFPGEEIKQIKSISVTNHQSPKENFEIKKAEDGSYQFYNFEGELQDAHKGMILSYLNQFHSVAFEGYEERKTEAYLDSIVTNSQPMYTIKLSTDNGESTSITSWPKPLNSGALDLVTGDSILYDVNRFYAVINDEELVIAQYQIFEVLAVNPKIFDK